MELGLPIPSVHARRKPWRGTLYVPNYMIYTWLAYVKNFLIAG